MRIQGSWSYCQWEGDSQNSKQTMVEKRIEQLERELAAWRTTSEWKDHELAEMHTVNKEKDCELAVAKGKMCLVRQAAAPQNLPALPNFPGDNSQR